MGFNPPYFIEWPKLDISWGSSDVRKDFFRQLPIFWQFFLFKINRSTSIIRNGARGIGGPRDFGSCISKFLAVGRSIFPKNGDFFEILEMYLPTPPQKSLFIAFLLTYFPKISKKVLKNFSWRLRRRENPPFSIFRPPGTDLTGTAPQYLGQSTEPHPPPNILVVGGKILGAKRPNSMPKAPFHKILAIFSEKLLFRNAIKNKNCRIKGLEKNFVFFWKIVSKNCNKMWKLGYIRVFCDAEGAAKFFWPLSSRYFAFFS